LAAKVALPMSILVAGTALNGLINAPYALQLAHGSTRLPLVSNIIALALGIPFCILGVRYWGMSGAACLWLAINVTYVLLLIPLIHRRLLPREIGSWYLRDVLPPLATALTATLLAKWTIPTLQRDLSGLVWLLVIGMTVLATTAMASAGVRSLLNGLVRRMLSG
jgi:O-antigen/teichoic acid export membrane protein